MSTGPWVWPGHMVATFQPSKIFTQIKHSSRILSGPRRVARGRHHKPYHPLLVHLLGHLLSLTHSAPSRAEHSLRWADARTEIGFTTFTVLFHPSCFPLPSSHAASPCCELRNRNQKLAQINKMRTSLHTSTRFYEYIQQASCKMCLR